jgi:DNA-directed RNA polymerase specialized sigma24 family protein
MIIDGYGEQLTYEQQLEILDDHDRVLAQYHKWLHWYANLIQKTWAHNEHDDLVQGTTVMSLMDDDLTLTAVLEAADLLEAVEISYHRGEILSAISALSTNQRRYVVYRFWLGFEPSWRGAGISFAEALGVERPDRLWTEKDRGARDRLREKLLHLESV